MLYRIGPRLIAATIIFLTALAISAGALFVSGLQQSQANAVERSSQQLVAVHREAMLTLTLQEAQTQTVQFQSVTAAARQMVALLQSAPQLQITAPVDPDVQLARQPAGYYADIRPERISDTHYPRSYPVDAAVLRELRESALLDALFPDLLKEYPDVVAAYYMGRQLAFVRFYPVINFAEIVEAGAGWEEHKKHDPAAYYYNATPERNPARSAVWTEPYLDPTGLGLMVTLSLPIYQGDTFQGVFALDVSLQRLIERLNTIKTTPSSYAFLVGSGGRLVAAPARALADLAPEAGIASPTLTDTLGVDLAASGNPAIQQALESLNNNEHGIIPITLAHGPALLSYAPIRGTGWGLAVIAPVAEITATTSTMIADIEHSNQAVLTSGLLLLLSFALAALTGAVLVSRWLTHPIGRLIKGARAVAAGDLTTRISISSRNEFGELAETFNTMIREIGRTRQKLEESNQHLEQTIAERTSELEAANRKLLEMNRDLAQLSAQDGLTGIANRRHFDQVLANEWQRAIREGSRLALILIDVDCFKLFNDTYGHQQGDVCLQQVAGALNTMVRRGSDLVARYGGEEFALILPSTDEEGAAMMAERLRLCVLGLAIPHLTSTAAAVVTISQGAASIAPLAGAAPGELIAAADQALYQAKHAGRNCVRSTTIPESHSGSLDGHPCKAVSRTFAYYRGEEKP